MSKQKRPKGAGAITAAGYVSIQIAGRYCYEHVKKAEIAIGRKLPRGAQVHHVDGNRTNNANNNLVVCPNQEYHRLLHRRTAAYIACGQADYLPCRYCKQYDAPLNLQQDGSRSFSHSACRSKYRRSLYKKRKADGKAI